VLRNLARDGGHADLPNLIGEHLRSEGTPARGRPAGPAR
jgi:hypothetical protein